MAVLKSQASIDIIHYLSFFEFAVLFEFSNNRCFLTLIFV